MEVVDYFSKDFIENSAICYFTLVAVFVKWRRLVPKSSKEISFPIPRPNITIYRWKNPFKK
jgi:hypothetical protein